MRYEHIRILREQIDEGSYPLMERLLNQRTIDGLSDELERRLWAKAAADLGRAKLARHRLTRRDNDLPPPTAPPSPTTQTAGLPLLILGPGGDFVREVWPGDLD